MATGAVSTSDLGAESDGSIPVISSDAAAQGLFNEVKFDLAGTRALMVDVRANYETALVMESLAKRGSKVTVATPYLHFGVNIGASHQYEYLQSLPALGIEVLPTTVVARVQDGEAHLRHAFSGAISPQGFDFIVAGSSPTPRDELWEVFARYAPVKMAGDVVAPRSALEAYREGDRAGRTV